jgi:hypothetical protein
MRPSEETYSAGIQDDETEAFLDCGCLLTTDGSKYYEDSCDIALHMCSLHSRANELLDEAKHILAWFDGTKDEHNMARIHACGLDRLRAIVQEIAKA